MQSGLARFPGGADDAYELIGRSRFDLMVDVGAASGETAQRMLAEKPTGRVVAFEPFPGNHPYIEAVVEREDRITLIKKAVANHNRDVSFYVPSIVKSGAGKWAAMDGYSSTGHIVGQADPRSADSIKVPTCQLDDELSGGVAFLKIDVQGQEFAVLDGARRLFDDGVDVALVEYTGDRRVMEFFLDRDYEVFDTNYFSTNPAAFRDGGWVVDGARRLSSGAGVATAHPEALIEDPLAYSDWLLDERRKYTSVWTDLIFVKAGY